MANQQRRQKLTVMEPDHTDIRCTMTHSPTDVSLYCLPEWHLPGEFLHDPVVSPAAAHLSYAARAQALHWDIYRGLEESFGLPFPYDQNVLPHEQHVFPADPAHAEQENAVRPPTGIYRPNYVWVEEGTPLERGHAHRHDGLPGRSHPRAPVTPEREMAHQEQFSHGYWQRQGDLFQQLPNPRGTSERTRDAFYPRVGHHTNLLDPRDRARLWPAVVREREAGQAEVAEVPRPENVWRARQQDVQDRLDALYQAVVDYGNYQ